MDHTTPHTTSQILKSGVKQNFNPGETINYSKEKEARMNSKERIYHPELSESKMQRIIKALEIAQRAQDDLMQEKNYILSFEEKCRLTIEAEKMFDLYKELQMLEHDSL